MDLAKNKPDGKVLVLYTGGTIGMTRNENGVLLPAPNLFVKSVKNYPQLHDRNYAEQRFGLLGPLVLPISVNENKRVIYQVLEYSPLMDSSDMKMDDWIKIATDIKKSYEYFDGFVILHGTDTLSYTASALSFMLEALGKTIIVTGSQLPIFDVRSDGLNNFLTSLVIAGNHNIPEVCVFFGNKLMRGNRTIKIAAASFDAFDSCNFPPLAITGIKIQVNHHTIHRSCALEKFHVHRTLNKNVGLLRIFPSITKDFIKKFLQPPIEGVVLQSYGAGNLPANRKDIIQEFRNATENGIIIVNITQCSKDGVTDAYESGKMLVEAGVTLGSDMTVEAALTKLAYVLSKNDWNIEKKRKMIETNLRGELTSYHHQINFQKEQVFMRWLGFHSEVEFMKLEPIIFPALMAQAVVNQELSKIELFIKKGIDNLSILNADSRTILHIACSEGNINIVSTLLKFGANVHIKDRFNRTPLTEAIENDFHEIIKLLVKCGAHLHEEPLILGEKLTSAASAGNLKRFQSFLIAGADLNQSDIYGRTALHNATLFKRKQLVQFLINHHLNPESTDLLGQTPIKIARFNNSQEILQILLHKS